jgi:hypothetical protein
MAGYTFISVSMNHLGERKNNNKDDDSDGDDNLFFYVCSCFEPKK